ncbi:MAG: hypothetical protein Q9164_004580 [Protoblastenia rupestris]
MAPVAVVAPDLQNLSCNWKKLRETLKSNEASNPPKRKASGGILLPQHHNEKRRKTEPGKSSTPSQRIMGNQKTPSMGTNGLRNTKEMPSASLAQWAEDNDIPARDLAAAYGTSLKTTTTTPETEHTEDKINEGLSSTAEAGKFVAIDCEMVGVGPDPNNESALARVSVVNYHGHQVYDSFVQPKETVTDFRTHVSGITPHLLQSARTLEVVQADIAKLLDGKILVGHAVRNDLDALLLGHPKRDIRDTSRHPAFRLLAKGRTPGLKKLAREVLGMEIQGGEHSSIEDARTTMLLFRREKESFEREHISKWGPDRRVGVEDTGRDAKKAKGKKRKKKARK